MNDCCKKAVEEAVNKTLEGGFYLCSHKRRCCQECIEGIKQELDEDNSEALKEARKEFAREKIEFNKRANEACEKQVKKCVIQAYEEAITALKNLSLESSALSFQVPIQMAIDKIRELGEKL